MPALEHSIGELSDRSSGKNIILSLCISEVMLYLSRRQACLSLPLSSTRSCAPLSLLRTSLY